MAHNTTFLKTFVEDGYLTKKSALKVKRLMNFPYTGELVWLAFLMFLVVVDFKYSWEFLSTLITIILVVGIFFPKKRAWAFILGLGFNPVANLIVWGKNITYSDMERNPIQIFKDNDKDSRLILEYQVKGEDERARLYILKSLMKRSSWERLPSFTPAWREFVFDAWNSFPKK